MIEIIPGTEIALKLIIFCFGISFLGKKTKQKWRGISRRA
jgi:hypothetical protein